MWPLFEMALYFQHQPEIRRLLYVVIKIHYNIIQLSVSLLSFLYINPQCLTDVRQAIRTLSLTMDFQVDNRCNSRQRQNFFFFFACMSKPILWCTPPHAEGHKGVKQTLNATNCQCNLTSSPPMHHSPPWSVKFRIHAGLSTLNPNTIPAWCLGLMSTIN